MFDNKFDYYLWINNPRKSFRNENVGDLSDFVLRDQAKFSLFRVRDTRAACFSRLVHPRRPDANITILICIVSSFNRKIFLQ